MNRVTQVAIQLGQVKQSINELYIEQKELEKQLVQAVNELREEASMTGKTVDEILYERRTE